MLDGGGRLGTTHIPASMRKLDSAVILERLDSAASSSHAYLRSQSTFPSPRTTDDTDGTDSSTVSRVERGEDVAEVVTTVGLDVSIRFGRLGALTAVAVSVLVALTVTFNHGMVLGHFDPAITDADARKKLLDDYNSYTGNVASLLGGPLEIFIALAVQVVLLRVLTASLLRTEICWQTDAITLAVSATIGYLVSNSLNALNVQPQLPVVEPIISAADLSYVPDVSTSADAALRSTNLTQIFSERAARNPITNTILRNLVLPRVATTKPQCRNGVLLFTLPNLVPEYWFPQRDWQSRLLQEAPETKQLRVVTNPSNNKTATHSPVNVDDLPMNVSLAADLFTYSMFAVSDVLQWPNDYDGDFVDGEGIAKRYPTGGSDTAARVFGLVPPASLALGETEQREWFLRASATALTRKLKQTANFSRSDAVMEFAHVDLSPSMRFDALTIEVEVDPLMVADVRSKDNATRYNMLFPSYQCGHEPLRCLLLNPMPNPVGSSRQADDVYDPPAQVQVFAACVNDNGTEELFFSHVLSDSFNIVNIVAGLECDRSSNTSLMVMSVGKRFVADAITQNKAVNASGILDQAGDGVVTNLRRIYSYTVAKLSWELSDLNTTYSASCAQDAGACQGLQLDLAPAAKLQAQPQQLIVGVDALPMNLIELPSMMRPTLVPLVLLHEPLSVLRGNTNKPLAVDPLLPHNFGTVTWNTTNPVADFMNCDSTVDERLQLVMNNHLYIEHGLQAAYTAATFFLLQNAVVKDVIRLNATHTSLNFLQNKQRVALLVSIPNQNACLTLAGCAVLVLGLCSAISWSWARGFRGVGGLGEVTTPHVVARVMLDAKHFPPLFLHRRVVSAPEAKLSDSGRLSDSSEREKPAETNTRTVEGFVIDGLTLQPPPAENGSSGERVVGINA